VSTLDGKHQGGVPFVGDTVEGRYERSVDQVLAAARDVLALKGTLTVDNVVGKNLEAKVDNRTVWVAVEAVTPTLTRLAIQVRTKGGGTDKELAHYLREEVAVRLASGNLAPGRPSQPVK
jgi:hypothetical protein